MCIDFTNLNAVCLRDRYPQPSVNQLVDKGSGPAMLSFMDAHFCYNQVLMAKVDEEKMTFITKEGNFYYTIMPFGLCNVEATFQ